MMQQSVGSSLNYPKMKLIGNANYLIKWYKLWEKFILIWAIYSTFFTPTEFAFFKGLPRKLFLLDICGQIAFLVDIVAAGRQEGVRYLLWIRLSRVRRVTDFFTKMEKDIRINYLFTRIVKLITVELYCSHTAACIFYYLATTLPEEKEGYTWIGSLTLGDYSYSNFREIDLWRRYITSLYFAIVTMATVGEGETGRGLQRGVSNPHQQGESSRSQSTELLDPYKNNKVTRVREEFFLPGEVIMEQGHVVDQLYFVCHGVLEEFGIGEDGSEETVALLEPYSSFGEISILCNIPQPYTVRVSELCRLIRIDKQSFSAILETYFHDGRRILTNLLEGKDSDLRVKQLETEITFHIGKQEADLSLKGNSTAYHGDLHQLKSLIRAGANPDKKDYDGRSPLHLAASRGYEDISFFRIQEGVDLNASDNFGNTPLFEAIKNGHDRVTSLLIKEGAFLKIENAGSFLCMLVTKGDSDLLRRLLSNGIDPNSKDYDYRTPLHVAASQGLFAMARLLLGGGASVFSKDRTPIMMQMGKTPVDEARLSGNNQLIKLLEEAKSAQIAEFPSNSHEISEQNITK
ncbi:hypothetical protein RND71_026136 [Anisodus tanguticus]|uniref:Potassium channel n=1 Tax=Anisodus tanguticus TaxID=243964 RepID=A0AAE1RNB6_9SOLA|nr:hypothetical protein RND71_026136 [Anisodus tanguticus]